MTIRERYEQILEQNNASHSEWVKWYDRYSLPVRGTKSIYKYLYLHSDLTKIIERELTIIYGRRLVIKSYPIITIMSVIHNISNLVTKGYSLKKACDECFSNGVDYYVVVKIADLCKQIINLHNFNIYIKSKTDRENICKVCNGLDKTTRIVPVFSTNSFSLIMDVDYGTNTIRVNHICYCPYCGKDLRKER